jgi:tRNA U34 5-methylaminomethyl-2-thiouridine-forming methyltransferase MnmC
MSTEIITTKDGSHTLYSARFNEIYHSRNGAVTESLHVFISNGLRAINSTRIQVLEVGLGTGLNALLAWQFATANQIYIEYHSVENYPIPESIFRALNYYEFLNNPSEAKKIFFELHWAEWNKQIPINNFFSLSKQQANLSEVSLTKNAFDIIFFDAFAPQAQPEMWELPIFEKMFESLKAKGMLVTYCSKGSVRRTMIQAGFSVEKLPGPPGKKEMLRAIKE